MMSGHRERFATPVFQTVQDKLISTKYNMNYIIAGLPFPLVWAGRALDRQWSADDLQTLTLAVPSTFTVYNVEEMAPVETTKQNYTSSFGKINISTANSSNPVAIGHFYALVDGEPQTLTLQYNGPLDNAPKPISNVPLAPNTHVVLSGDVANSGLTSGNITATVDNEWSDSSQNF